MQRSPKLAASVSVSVPQSVDAATALLALMAAERGGHKTVDGRVPNDPAWACLGQAMSAWPCFRARGRGLMAHR